MIIFISIIVAAFKFCFIGEYFDFKKFIVANQKVEEPSIPKINIDKIASDNDFLKKSQKIIEDIGNVLKDKKIYNKAKNDKLLYYDKLSKNFTTGYLEDLKSQKEENYLYEVTENIYKEENCNFISIKIIAITREIENDSIKAEIISNNDTAEFDSQILDISFDKEMKITKIEKFEDIKSVANSTKELNEDSVIDNSLHEVFKEKLSEFFNGFKNKDIYELSLDKKKEKDFEYEIETLIETLSIKNKDKDSLIELFLMGKGEFKNYAISGYTLSDINADPITTYSIGFYHNETFEYINIEFNRYTQEIINIFS